MDHPDLASAASPEIRHAQTFSHIKYTAGLIAMPSGALGCFIGYRFAVAAASPNPADVWGLPVLGGYLAIAALWLWWRPRTQPRLEQTGFVLLALYLLAALGFQLLTHAGGAQDLLGPRSYWLFFVYLLAFVVWEARPALYACLTIIMSLTALLVIALTTRVPVHPVPLDAFVQLLLASIAYVALHAGFAQLRTQYVHMRDLAFTDALTGCFNRRRGNTLLDEARVQAQNRARPLSVILFDLDHFKRINDEYGHAVGDTTLQAVARAVRAQQGKRDQLCRWGGEEFLLICPERSIEEAQVLAERLRAHIAHIRLGRDRHLSASFGIACHRRGDTLDTLLNRADHAMYRAKDNGRNCVTLARLSDTPA